MIDNTRTVSAIQDLITTVARLRGPGGCPWDQEQTHASLCDPLIEETAELLDTIDRNDFDHMREELGDVLLQVVMHTQMTHEAGLYDFDAVAREINEKLIRRHPHVFGDMQLKDTDAVLNQWEAIKAEEKKSKGDSSASGLFKHLPPALPALLYARDVCKLITRHNIPLPDADGIISLAEDLTEEAAGELLFQVAAACREAGIDPESALRRHTSSTLASIQNAHTDSSTTAL